MSTPETHRFQAEVTRLLRLVVDSLYSHKEVFMRELVSNASDALDRLRFEAVSDKGLLAEDERLEIRLHWDADAGTVTVEDTGIGMTRDEMIQNLGTIAHSGSQAFLSRFEAADNGEKVSLIGQFGVGFYSAFLVAERVEVVSRSAHGDAAHRWQSDARESYTIEEAERTERGTAVVLHLKEDQKKFLDRWELKELVRRYSDFVSHPIKMTKADDTGTWETINEASALWTRPRAEITAEQYEELYRHISHDWEPPLAHTHFTIEGMQLFTGLLYLPRRAPMDLNHRDFQRGVRLYVKRVLIMETCADLLPEWLRFVRGVVDSDDLPLNVSRELLQDSAVTRVIRKQVTKKALDLIEELAAERPEDYATFWGACGAVLREGLHFDAARKDQLLRLVRYRSSAVDGLTSLAEYVGRMKEGQPAIYYITGDSVDAVKDSPHLEALRGRGYEVLYMTDRVDEWVTPALETFEEKPFCSAVDAELDLQESDEVKEIRKQRKEALGPFLTMIQERLEPRGVKEVRLSSRLTESPCCLVVPEGGVTAHLERILRAHDTGIPAPQRILELNPDHPLIRSLETLHSHGGAPEAIQELVDLLHDQALITEGSPLADSHLFARRLTTLMTLRAAREVEARTE